MTPGGSHPRSSDNLRPQRLFCRARFWRGCTRAASTSLPQPKPVWLPLPLPARPCWSRARRVPAGLSRPRQLGPRGAGWAARAAGRGRGRGRRNLEGCCGPFSNRLRSLQPLLPCWASPNLSLLWQIQFAIEKCAFCASAVARIFPSASSSPLRGSPGGFRSGCAG